jgi:hypothetical protein
VTALGHAAGICGYSRGTSISGCYNTGDISGTYAGGITAAGVSEEIIKCYNTGKISADSFKAYSPVYAGGICAEDDLYKLSDCYNVGEVSASSATAEANAGGICGHNGQALNCYNTGGVSANNFAGGICGNRSFGNIKNCIVLADSIYGDNGSYLIAHGLNHTSSNNNLVLEGFPNYIVDDSDGLITLKQAKSQATYTDLNWDFDKHWQMVPGYYYPQLRGLPPAGPQSVTVTLDGVAANQELGEAFNSLFHYEANLCSAESGYDVLYSGEIDRDSVIPTPGTNKGKGVFSFEDVENGCYILELKVPGYITRYHWVDIDDNNLNLGTYSLTFGDFNGDFAVNQDDIDLFKIHAGAWYQDGYPDPYHPQYDYNCDGRINGDDLEGMHDSFGKNPYNVYDDDMMEIYGLLHKAVWVTLNGVADNQDLGDDFNKLFIYRVALRDPEDATIKYTGKMSVLPGTRVGYKSTGLFTFEGVDDGKYILELKAPGYMTKWEYVTIEPDTRDLGNRELMFGDFDGNFFLNSDDQMIFTKTQGSPYNPISNHETFQTMFDYDCNGCIDGDDLMGGRPWGRDYEDYGQGMIDIYENVPLRKLLLGEKITVTLDGVAANQELGKAFNSLFHYEANLRSAKSGYDVLYSGEMNRNTIPKPGTNKGKGVFVFEDVPNGRYILELKAPGYITRYHWVDIDDDNLNLGSYSLVFGDFDGDFAVTQNDLDIFKNDPNRGNYWSVGNLFKVQYDWDCNGVINATDQMAIYKGQDPFNSYDADMAEIYVLIHGGPVYIKEATGDIGTIGRVLFDIPSDEDFLDKYALVCDEDINVEIYFSPKRTENAIVAGQNTYVFVVRLPNGETREDISFSIKPIGGDVEKNKTIIYGDINEDGVVTTTDATLVTRWAGGNTATVLRNILAADANGDAYITTTDATLITRRAGGSPVVFPIETRF